MGDHTPIKPTSDNRRNRFPPNAPQPLDPPTATLATLRWPPSAWLRPYLLAEVVGLLVALGNMTLAGRLTDNAFLLVAVSVYGGAVGYYSTLFFSLFCVLQQVKPLAGSRTVPYSKWRTIRTLLMTLGSAELVDSLLLSPLLLYLAIHLLPNHQLAVVVSEVVSTLAFYGTVSLVRRVDLRQIFMYRKEQPDHVFPKTSTNAPCCR